MFKMNNCPSNYVFLSSALKCFYNFILLFCISIVIFFAVICVNFRQSVNVSLFKNSIKQSQWSCIMKTVPSLLYIKTFLLSLFLCNKSECIFNLKMFQTTFHAYFVIHVEIEKSCVITLLVILEMHFINGSFCLNNKFIPVYLFHFCSFISFLKGVY